MERYHMFKLGLAVLFYAAYCIRPMMANSLEGANKKESKFVEEEYVYYQGVQGKPGVDFPILSRIPKTAFSCRNVESGYYADLETDCQVFHICDDEKKISFLCPNGTVFEQTELICEWWFKVNCTSSPNFYEESAEQLRENNARRKSMRKVDPSHGAVMRTEEKATITATQNNRNYQVVQQRTSKRIGDGQNNRISGSAEDSRRDKGDVEVSRRGQQQQQQQKYREGGQQISGFGGGGGQKSQDYNGQSSRQNEGNGRGIDNGQKNQQNYNQRNQNTAQNGRQSNQQNGLQSTKPNSPQNFQFSNQQGAQQQSPQNNNQGSTRPSNQNNNQANNQQKNQNGGSRGSFKYNQGNNQQAYNQGDRGQNNNQDIPSRSSLNIQQGFPQNNHPNYKVTDQKVHIYQKYPPSNQENGNQQQTPSSTQNPNTNLGINQNIEQNGKQRSNQRSTPESTYQSNQNNNPQVFQFRNNQPSTQSSKTVQHNNQPNNQVTQQQNNYQSFEFNQQSNRNRNTPRTEEQGTQKNGQEFTQYRNRKPTTQQSNNQENYEQANKENQPNRQTANSFVQFRTTQSITPQQTSYRDKTSYQTTPSSNLRTTQEDSSSTVSFQTTRNGKQIPQQNSIANDGRPTRKPKSQNILLRLNTVNNVQEFKIGNTQPEARDGGFIQQFGTEKKPQLSSGFAKAPGATGSDNFVRISVINTNERTGGQRSNQGSSRKQSQDKIKTGDPKSNQSSAHTTRNDITSKKLVEPSDSDETQILEETASFYKNSNFNTIQQTLKPQYSTSPHPNHRESYTDLKEPKYYSTKLYSAISSVTPQYLTTQSINNGRPFVGSQVGNVPRTKIVDNNPFNFAKVSFEGPPSTSTTTVSPTRGLFNVGNTDQTIPLLHTESTTPANIELQRELFNVGKTDNTLVPLPLSTTLSPPVPVPHHELLSPPIGSFNIGLGSVSVANSNLPETTISKVIDHATVYGKFSESPSVLADRSTPVPTTDETEDLNLEGTGGAVLNRFGGSTQRVPLHGKVPLLGKTAKASTGVIYSGSKISIDSTTTRANNGFAFQTSPGPNSITETSPPKQTGFYISKTLEAPSGQSLVFPQNQPTFTATPPPAAFAKSAAEILRPRPFQISTKGNTYLPKVTQSIKDHTTTVKPTYPSYQISSASPFALPKHRAEDGVGVGVTLSPTQPTPYVTTQSPYFDSVDNMINTLVDMANRVNAEEYLDSTARPGLVVPPSVGPQTLHTLAVYFANALDGIAADKGEDVEEEVEPKDLTEEELEKKKLTDLLTKMTMNRYNELFKETHTETTTILSTRSGEDDSDLTKDSSDNAVESPKVRQLAKVFTQALSSYLDDPATFRKVLEEVRPTEPADPAGAEHPDDTDANQEDELLKFSDADTVSSFPPILPTLPSVRPTWGYIVSFNNNNSYNVNKNKAANHDLDVKNSLQENLQLADSQSFVSQFNKLQTGGKAVETSTRSSLAKEVESLNENTGLPNGHWTTSPGASKLWKSTFSFDPKSINHNFAVTEPSSAPESTTADDSPLESTEEPQHHAEIKYELRALPQLTLNSTQVHGILIDFMNTSRTDSPDNKLHRILKKLNTTEEEFLSKMREIEANPLTRRLVLLLISECGENASKEINMEALPVHSLLNRASPELLDTASSIAGFPARQSSTVKPPRSSSPNFRELVDPSVYENSEDARALQLLNSLYSIASKFGK